MSAWDDTPSDVNPTPLPTDKRDAKIINFDAINLRRMLKNQLGHDLANAFRSADAGQYDEDGSAA